MTLIFEIIRAVVLGIAFFYLFFKTRNTALFNTKGWFPFVMGIGLLFLGTVVDVSDQFPELSYFGILGQTNIQAFVEKILGYTLGGVLIFWGSIRFIPTILETLKLKEELKKSNEELEGKVKERTADLEKANNVKNEFISMMSHEIRTPLNAIKGMTYNLYNSDLNDNQRERIHSIDTSADLLLSIFNNILYYSETESGKLKSNKISFNCEEMFYQLFSNYKEAASEKNMEFVVKSGKDIPEAVTTEVEILKHIIMIFIENAIKYTEKGKIEVVCKTVVDNDDSSKISVSVQDTGLGISEEKQKILTQSFTQNEQTSTRKFGGIGLGLAIVGRLCEISDGELQLESQRDIGSTFTILLPCEIAVTTKSNFYFDNSDDLKNEKAKFEENKLDEVSINKINEMFVNLTNLLQQYDSEAIDLLKQIIEEFGFEHKFKGLEQSIQNYNFEEALAILEIIRKEFK